MGYLATVVEFLRSEVEGVPAPEAKVDRGGSDTVTGYLFGPPGDDSPPLAGDVAYLGEDIGAGNAQILGHQDPKNAGVALPGERRSYARSSDGAVVAEIWAKRDGAIRIANLLADAVIEVAAGGAVTVATGEATAELAPDGAISLANGTGGLAIDAAGNVTATTSLGSFGSGTHTHSSPFGPTGPPIAGT